MKVLVVDDSSIIRRAVTKVVTGLGYQAIEAENGADALAKIRTNANHIGLIILDWNMPVMDGIDVLKKIKSSNDYSHIPVLMATSDGIKEDVIEALRAGATSYLVKPFDPSVLSERINEIIEPMTKTKPASRQ